MRNAAPALPPIAAAKFGSIADAELNMHNSIQTTLSRIRELENQVEMLKGSEEAGGIEMEIGRLRGVLAVQQTRLTVYASLLSLLRLYRNKTAHVELEDAPRITPRLKPGEPLPDAVKRVRDEIERLGIERGKVSQALLPLAEQKAQAAHYVNELRQGVRVRLKFEPFEVVFDTNSAGFSFVRWLAWFAPDALKKRLQDEIENQTPADALILSGPERKQRLSEIKARLDRLNREEEALIVQAQETEHEILRRIDADPAAVLGVRRKRTKAVAA